VGRLRNGKKKEPRTECYWENEGKLSKRATGKNGRTQVNGVETAEEEGTWGDGVLENEGTLGKAGNGKTEEPREMR
jgi:hypothetical protein